MSHWQDIALDSNKWEDDCNTFKNEFGRIYVQLIFRLLTLLVSGPLPTLIYLADPEEKNDHFFFRPALSFWLTIQKSILLPFFSHFLRTESKK